MGGIPYYVLSVVFGEPRSHMYLRQVFPTVLWAVTAACLEHVVMRFLSKPERTRAEDQRHL
jgi:hypothetical protein